MTNRLLVILIAAISLIGCTTMRSVDLQETDLTEFIEVGDELVVYDRKVGTVVMKVTDIDEKTITGIRRGHRVSRVVVNIDDIVRLEVEKVDGAKTTLAIVGAAGGFYVVVRAFAEALGNAANSQIHW